MLLWRLGMVSEEIDKDTSLIYPTLLNKNMHFLNGLLRGLASTGVESKSLAIIFKIVEIISGTSQFSYGKSMRKQTENSQQR